MAGLSGVNASSASGFPIYSGGFKRRGMNSMQLDGGNGTNQALATMDFAYLGGPFIDVPASNSVNLLSMDYAYLGGPFISYARAP